MKSLHVWPHAAGTIAPSVPASRARSSTSVAGTAGNDLPPHADAPVIVAEPRSRGLVFGGCDASVAAALVASRIPHGPTASWE